MGSKTNLRLQQCFRNNVSSFAGALTHHTDLEIDRVTTSFLYCKFAELYVLIQKWNHLLSGL